MQLFCKKRMLLRSLKVFYISCVMAKKKGYLKITNDKLKQLLALGYSSLNENSSFHGKEVFFTDGLDDQNKYILYQCVGNIGGFTNQNLLEKENDYIIFSDKMLNGPNSKLYKSFVMDLEKKYNQKNSPYTRIKLIAESDLLDYLKKRAERTNDELLASLINKYLNSKKQTPQLTLFD